ncbi:MAG: YcxB family protein [Candidatus Sulfotelmatobacter sp.]
MTPPEMQSPGKSIHLEFVLSKEEFFEGQKIFCSSLGTRWVRFNYKGIIPVGVFLIVEGAILLLLHVRWFVGTLVAAFGLYLLLKRLVLWPWKMRREFEKYPDHEAVRTFEIDENGVTAATPLGSGAMLWARFSKFAETERGFFVLAPPRFLYTIPKRAVPPELLGFLSSLLSQRLTRVR